MCRAHSRCAHLVARTGAEVRLDDSRVLADVDGTALGDLLAVIEDDDAIAHLHDEAHVVLNEKYRQALVAKPGDELHQLPLLLSVETGSRLVEQKQTRLGRQRAGDLQTALQSVWHLAGVGAGVPCETKKVQEVERSLFDGSLFPPGAAC